MESIRKEAKRRDKDEFLQELAGAKNNVVGGSYIIPQQFQTFTTGSTPMSYSISSSPTTSSTYSAASVR